MQFFDWTRVAFRLEWLKIGMRSVARYNSGTVLLFIVLPSQLGFLLQCMKPSAVNLLSLYAVVRAKLTNEKLVNWSPAIVL